MEALATQLTGARAGQRVLDLASGTGDHAARLAGLVGPRGLVVMTDINAAMLARGRDRMLDEGRAGNVRYAQLDAEALPFPDGPRATGNNRNTMTHGPFTRRI